MASITGNIKAENEKLRKDKKRRNIVILVLLMLFLALLFVVISRFTVAAYVNGSPISRLSVIKQLESQGGQEVLDNLVNKTLIEQAAGKLGIKVNSEDIEKEIASIEELVSQQGMTLEEALELQGQTKDDLYENIRVQLLIEAALADKIAVSDEAVQEYFDENKDFLGEDVSFEEAKDQLKEQLIQQETSTAYQEWVTFLREEAEINYIIVY